MDFLGNFDQQFNNSDYYGHDDTTPYDTSNDVHSGIIPDDSSSYLVDDGSGHHGMAYLDTVNAPYDDGNINDLLNYHDPLMHSSEYHCMPLHLHSMPEPPHTIIVDGYNRADGTHVQAHVRTTPDGIEYNNLSYNKNR